MSNINFGIDLGTSNSLIAKFEAGSVEVFKNPSGFRETLPSVVGYRNGRVLIGAQAQAHLPKDPKSFASRFKRKMGTNEAYLIDSTQQRATPEELSAHVLRELKTFIHTGEDPRAAVITIPASFDTAQSNATRSAAKLAGFETVFLLQEPIAASLAYANKEKGAEMNNGLWLVYDLGGGTFDAALVRILDGELSIIDHEGDNYLGGGDLDEQIVEKIIVPEIERRGFFSNLLGEMKSASGKRNKLWHLLLPAAEAAKVELSSRTSTDLELDLAEGLVDDNGRPVDGLLEIQRAQIESLARKPVERTIELMKKILARNNLAARELQFILMVGGATLMPFVRKLVEQQMGIPVNTSIDPTSAICVGAAYYASTKAVNNARSVEGNVSAEPSPYSSQLDMKVSYNASSQEMMEIFSAKFGGHALGMTYRITGDDGAFDSGIKQLHERISEELPLRRNAFNSFNLKVFDHAGRSLRVASPQIHITQGKYSIAGQMLPEDLCLIKDDLAAGDTKLDALFRKNTSLPATATRTVEASKLLAKGHADMIQIMVVEGDQSRHSSTNKLIGILGISGSELERSLPKGSYVDLEFKISESRDVSVSAEIISTGQKFSDIFKPKQRSVSPQRVAKDLDDLSKKIMEEKNVAMNAGDPQTSSALADVREKAAAIAIKARSLPEDDVTDEKFQLDDQARELAQKVFELTSNRRVSFAKIAYRKEREALEAMMPEANAEERKNYSAAINVEECLLRSGNSKSIEAATEKLWKIRGSIQFRSVDFQAEVFKWLEAKTPQMQDKSDLEGLIALGRSAVRNRDLDELRSIINLLARKLPQGAAEGESINLVGII